MQKYILRLYCSHSLQKYLFLIFCGHKSTSTYQGTLSGTCMCRIMETIFIYFFLIFFQHIPLCAKEPYGQLGVLKPGVARIRIMLTFMIYG